MKILIFSPHPDDEAIGCGGVILKHTKHFGNTVQTYFMTLGGKGCPGRDEEETEYIRQGEAQRAASRLGTLEPRFLPFKDGEVANYTERDVTKMAHQIDIESPDAIFIPWINDVHPDHKATSKLVIEAMAKLAAEPQVFMYEVWTPLPEYDLVEDISEWIGTKLLAIREHYSQVDRIRFDEAALSLARWRGELHNRPHGPYAEVFKRFV